MLIIFTSCNKLTLALLSESQLMLRAASDNSVFELDGTSREISESNDGWSTSRMHIGALG